MRQVFALPFPDFHRSARVVRIAWLGCCLLAGQALPASAVERIVRIDAPATAPAGSKVTVPVLARTDAGNGEQIGFFHAEYSTDGGKTWTGFCYEETAGVTATRLATFTAGPAGSKARVRVRIAFRGGVAGDVDFNGAALKWKDSWEKWQSPPAKISTISVVAP
ncbi:MAG: hypothetical protein HYV75_03580 [Opitutae bacterium]|nr:hypothetical protein [Opitutae bacterium]